MQAEPSWECHGGDLARGRDGGREQDRDRDTTRDRDRDRDSLHCSGWIPSCRAVQGAARSRSGNKDMISSGVNFLGALKNGAGKIWSTVIMEEDKDKKVSGGVPGLGTPEHLRKSSRASPAPSQIILDAWAMNITAKRVGRTNREQLIREQRWGKVTAWRRKGILFPWQLKFEKKVSGNQCHLPVCAPAEHSPWAARSRVRAVTRRASVSQALWTTVSPPGQSASHEAAPAGEGETSKTTSKPPSQGPQAPPWLLKLSHFHGMHNRDKVTASTSPIISWHCALIIITIHRCHVNHPQWKTKELWLKICSGN